MTINARIVVIGASDTGIAFLESIAFCPHLRFNNVTLVSPHGLPHELPPDELRRMMRGHSECYQREDATTMSLRSWINVVYGKMTGIDRRKKFVIVDKGLVVPYDHLVITCGLQYQTPNPTNADIEQNTSHDLPVNPRNPNNRYCMGAHSSSSSCCWSNARSCDVEMFGV